MKVLFENIETEIINILSFSKKRIYISVAWFTNQNIFTTLLNLLNNNISIELIILPDEINFSKLGLNFAKFIKSGGLLYIPNNEKILHHKFCIIDEIVITGSYNWTYYAENKNYENIVIINDNYINKLYTEEFKKLVKKSKFISDIDDVKINIKPYYKDFDTIINHEWKALFQYHLKNKSPQKQLAEILKQIYLKNKYDYKYIFDNFNKLNQHEIKEEYISILEKLDSRYKNIVIRDYIQKNKTIFMYYQDRIKKVVEIKKYDYISICEKLKNLNERGLFLDSITFANNFLNYYNGKVSIYLYMGDAKKEIGDKEGSLISYKQALNNAKKINYSKTLYFDFESSYPCYVIGKILIKLKEFEKAKDCFRKAKNEYKSRIELIKNNKNFDNYISVLSDIKKNLKKVDKALQEIIYKR